MEDIKKRPYDPLDYGRTQFDRDLLEFNIKINDLEVALQVGVCVCVHGGGLVWQITEQVCYRGRPPLD